MTRSTNLQEFLESPESFTELDLNNKNIGNEGAISLAEALPRSNLVTLDLSNNKIGLEGVKAISEALKNNTSLENNTILVRLNLQHNNIGAAGGEAIGEALQKNHTLKELNLNRTQIADSGMSAIGESLKINRTLASLNISGNEIGPDGVRTISEAFIENHSLETVDLSCNKIGSDGAIIIKERLLLASENSNNTMKSLSLWGSSSSEKIDGRLLRELDDLMKANENLTRSAQNDDSTTSNLNDINESPTSASFSSVEEAGGGAEEAATDLKEQDNDDNISLQEIEETKEEQIDYDEGDLENSEEIGVITEFTNELKELGINQEGLDQLQAVLSEIRNQTLVVVSEEQGQIRGSAIVEEQEETKGPETVEEQEETKDSERVEELEEVEEQDIPLELAKIYKIIKKLGINQNEHMALLSTVQEQVQTQLNQFSVELGLHQDIIQALKQETGLTNESLNEILPLLSAVKRLAEREAIYQKEQENLEIVLNKDPYKIALHSTIQSELNRYYAAATLVETNLIATSKKGSLGQLGENLHLLAPHIQILGIGLELFADAMLYVDEKREVNKIGNLAAIASDYKQMEIIANITATILVHHDFNTPTANNSMRNNIGSSMYKKISSFFRIKNNNYSNNEDHGSSIPANLIMGSEENNAKSEANASVQVTNKKSFSSSIYSSFFGKTKNAQLERGAAEEAVSPISVNSAAESSQEDTRSLVEIQQGREQTIRGEKCAKKITKIILENIYNAKIATIGNNDNNQAIAKEIANLVFKKYKLKEEKIQEVMQVYNDSVRTLEQIAEEDHEAANESSPNHPMEDSTSTRNEYNEESSIAAELIGNLETEAMEC